MHTWKNIGYALGYDSHHRGSVRGQYSHIDEVRNHMAVAARTSDAARYTFLTLAIGDGGASSGALVRNSCTGLGSNWPNF